MKLAEAIKKYREKRGFTQVQMAKVLGITNMTVSNWENGRKRPHQKIVLDRIQRVFGKVKI